MYMDNVVVINNLKLVEIKISGIRFLKWHCVNKTIIFKYTLYD